MMWPTWVLTVASEMCSSAAISVLDRPEPTWASTSRSRAVSSARPSRSGAPSVVGRCGRKRPIRRRVVDGATTESPWCTLRMAYRSSSGGADLSRKPLAPARSAANAYSSRSKVVRMRTRGRSAAWQISRVAATPSIPGIRTSMTITSAGTLRASRTAAAPSAASPTTARSGWLPSTMAKPARTRSWSSTSSEAGRQDGGIAEGVGAAGQQDGRQCPVHEPWITAQPGVDPFHGPFHGSRVTSLVLRRLLTHRGG
jgi:hypothetical protein